LAQRGASDFRQVSARAKAVAKAKSLPEPKPIKPTSPAEEIEAALCSASDILKLDKQLPATALSRESSIAAAAGSTATAA
jgi:hypothetical protein